MKRCNWIFVISGAIIMLNVPVVGRAGEPQETGNVEVCLRLGAGTSSFGSLQYDPLDPTRRPSAFGGMPIPRGPLTLTLEIKNKTNHTILVPAKYDGEVFRLWGRSAEHHFSLRLWKRGKSQTKQIVKQIEIPPGKRHTCFSFRLSEILPTSPREVGWVWSWRAHPAPPLSPIHQTRGNEFVSAAVFWGELVLGNQILRTEPVIIEVKSQHVLPDNDKAHGQIGPDQPRG